MKVNWETNYFLKINIIWERKVSDRKEEHPWQSNISIRYRLSEEFRKYRDRGPLGPGVWFLQICYSYLGQCYHC